MTVREQVLVSPEEREAFRRRAEVEGVSLSAWLRAAGRERLAEAEEGDRLDSQETLRAFFDACDEREHGREPDWEEHLDVIRKAQRSGEAAS